MSPRRMTPNIRAKTRQPQEGRGQGGQAEVTAPPALSRHQTRRCTPSRSLLVMNAKPLLRLSALGLALFLQFPAVCAAQTKEVQEESIGSVRAPDEDWKALRAWVSPDNVVDMKKFQDFMTLKDALSMCGPQLSKKGFKL